MDLTKLCKMLSGHANTVDTSTMALINWLEYLFEQDLITEDQKISLQTQAQAALLFALHMDQLASQLIGQTAWLDLVNDARIESKEWADQAQDERPR